MSILIWLTVNALACWAVSRFVSSNGADPIGTSLMVLGAFLVGNGALIWFLW